MHVCMCEREANIPYVSMFAYSKYLFDLRNVPVQLCDGFRTPMNSFITHISVSSLQLPRRASVWHPHWCTHFLLALQAKVPPEKLCDAGRYTLCLSCAFGGGIVLNVSTELLLAQLLLKFFACFFKFVWQMLKCTILGRAITQHRCVWTTKRSICNIKVILFSRYVSTRYTHIRW